MQRTVEAVWKNGQVVPLEAISLNENRRLLVTILDVPKDDSTDWHALRGKYKNQLSSVDAFIEAKKIEKQLEL